MKLKKIIFIILCIMSFILIFSSNLKSKAYSTIDSMNLFEPSVFNTLELNYTTLPEITVSGNITDYFTFDTNGTVNRRTIYFYNCTAGQTLDGSVSAYFSNCGTLEGKSIDIKCVYSNIVMVADKDNPTYGVSNGGYLYWKAFGSQMTSTNEWFYAGIEKVDVDIYFYYSGETTPIDMDTAFLTLFSEDPGEGTSSKNATETFLYSTTNIKYYSSFKSTVTNKSYSNLYVGTKFGSTEAGGINAVCHKYQNVDHLSVTLYSLDGFNGNKAYVGYHFQYTPITATVPEDPVKTVDKEIAHAGDTLTYTVTQTMPKSYDDDFYLTSLSFTDVLDNNLSYESLKVYDQNNKDVTSSAGTTAYSQETKTLVYTFNSSYLKNMEYSGETYNFKITTKISESTTENIIQNQASLNFNNKYTISSNTVTTKLVGDVITYYKDLNENEIADSVTLTGTVGDSYETSAKEINGYTLIKDTGNTKGIYENNTIEVIYYYAKNSNVYVYYVDEEGNEIETTEKIEGHEGDEYTTIQKEIDGYYFKEVEGETEGIMQAEDITITYIYSKIEKGNLLIKKVDEYGNYLEGAVFKIATSEENAKQGNFIKDENGEDISKTSDSEGNVIFTDLVYKDETSNDEELGRSYWVVETKAPVYSLSNGETKSYSLLANPVEVKVNSMSGEYDETSTVKIVNKKSSTLPVTGANSIGNVFLSIAALLIVFTIILKNVYKIKLYKENFYDIK